MEKALAADGVHVLTGVSIERVTHAEGRFIEDFGAQQLQADKLLVAAGRRNNLSDIGLETVGLEPSARVLETDSAMRVGGSVGLSEKAAREAGVDVATGQEAELA